MVLDLIGTKSSNIMALIDERSKFPKCNDNTLLDKLHKIHLNNVNCNRSFMRFGQDLLTKYTMPEESYATKSNSVK